ncbi:MAG: LpxI family protein [Hyphomicrobium sp.]
MNVPGAVSGTVMHLGIVAGGGSLPLEIARSVTTRGGTVYVVMIEGEADDALRNFPHTILNWAELGHAVRAIKRAGMRDMVMVGRMSRPSFLTAKPDFGFLFSLPRIVSALRAGGDDAVLRGVVGLFESRKLRVLGVHDVAPELLLSDGPIGFHHPQPVHEPDILGGFDLVAALGRFDIGQAVVVSGERVEAIEGAEGTDRMLARVREQRIAQGADPDQMRYGVLVKRPKPGQDPRLDLPAIGPDTAQGVIAAGLAGIIGASNQVLAASRFEMLERADRAHIFIAGIPAPPAPETLPEPDVVEPIVFGGYSIPPECVSDVETGVHIMGTLDAFSTGSAVVIAHGRVLAIGAREPSAQVLERARPFLKRKKSDGVLIISPNESLDEPLIRQAAASGIAGIIVMFGPGDGAAHKGPVLDVADRFRLFVAGAATDPKVAAF